MISAGSNLYFRSEVDELVGELSVTRGSPVVVSACLHMVLPPLDPTDSGLIDRYVYFQKNNMRQGTERQPLK